MNKKNNTGIILAGGKSSRMNREKGLVLLNNKPFIQYSIEALQPLVSEIIIVSKNPDYDIFGIKRVEDIVSNAGPIAGLHAGLVYSKTENNLVLSCDVPMVTTSLLKRLISHNDDYFDVVQFKTKGTTTPLIALYKKRCTNTCEKLLLNGERRLRKLVSALNTKTVSVSKKEQVLVTNINTINELKTITNATDN